MERLRLVSDYFVCVIRHCILLFVISSSMHGVAFDKLGEVEMRTVLPCGVTVTKTSFELL